MSKTGELVLVKNEHDDTKERMYVILFDLWYEDKEYVCLSPISNIRINKRNYHYYSNNYVYIPFEILSNKKLCSVKITTTDIYEKDEINYTGLKLKPEIMLRIFDAIMNLDLERPKLNKEHYEYIQSVILTIKDDILSEEKKRKKEEKKLRNIRRKELKRNYNNIKNK